MWHVAVAPSEGPEGPMGRNSGLLAMYDIPMQGSLSVNITGSFQNTSLANGIVPMEAGDSQGGHQLSIAMGRALITGASVFKSHGRFTPAGNVLAVVHLLQNARLGT